MSCNSCGPAIEDCGCEGVQQPYIHGDDGAPGQNAYQIWLAQGNTGTTADFIASLAGQNGLTAYQQAVANGFVGSEPEWLLSLVGDDGLNGTNGFNGVNAYGYQANMSPGPQPQMPAVDGLVTVTLLPTPGNQTQWPALGQPIWVEGWGTMQMMGGPIGDAVILKNLGYPENAAPGTTLNASAKVAPTGFRGPTGPQGNTPITVDPDLPVELGVMPTDEPAPGTATRIFVDLTDPANPISYLIRWDSVDEEWDTVSRITGTAGARILFLAGDPNDQPSNYGENGWVVIDTGTAGIFTFWERIAPGTWTDRGSLQGGAATALFDMFRAGKAAAQPIPTGTTVPTTIQFELTSGLGRFNGGWWSGSSFIGASGITTPMRFILENLRIFRTTGSGESIDFDIDIRIKTVSEANATLSITSPATEVTLPVLATAFEAVDDTAVVDVIITPSGNPTEQWYVGFDDLVFYNQK